MGGFWEGPWPVGGSFGYKIGPKLVQNWLKLVPNWSKIKENSIQAQMMSENWSWKGLGRVLGWNLEANISQNGPQTLPKWSQFGSKVDQKLTKI